jgi:hypothetical protein
MSNNSFQCCGRPSYLALLPDVLFDLLRGANLSGTRRLTDGDDGGSRLTCTLCLSGGAGQTHLFGKGVIAAVIGLDYQG